MDLGGSSGSVDSGVWTVAKSELAESAVAVAEAAVAASSPPAARCGGLSSSWKEASPAEKLVIARRVAGLRSEEWFPSARDGRGESSGIAVDSP